MTALTTELSSIRDILPRVFKINKVTVQADIQNEQGDAIVTTTTDLMHLRATVLTEMRHEIKYDGEQPKTPNDIKVQVAGQPIQPVIIANYKKDSGDGFQRITHYKIPISNIGQNKSFSYSVSSSYPNSFSKLKNTTIEELVSWAMLHETEELEFIVNSPVDLIEKTFKAKDHTGVEDFGEENEIRQANTEPIIIDRRTLKWTVKRPNIGYTYELYFRASP